MPAAIQKGETMKRRLGLFLLGLALTAAALVSRPETAEAAPCRKPFCFASPGCCASWECDSWCGGTGLGICGPVVGGMGSCCSCSGPPES